MTGGVRGPRPTPADTLSCLPLLWNHRRAFCDHAHIIHMVIGYRVNDIYFLTVYSNWIGFQITQHKVNKSSLNVHVFCDVCPSLVFFSV